MAIDMTLKIDGADGESKIQRHENEIDVLAWSWGMSQSGSMHIGGGGGWLGEHTRRVDNQIYRQSIHEPYPQVLQRKPSERRRFDCS